ncbi:MFS general substrate transporter [Hesseltinella vesiculosa]|uniref:MFS general substrate transporter n=1 Tax=Hesseltinella vesiculosa TaxID=101127 RepID=A0A1X2GSX3_9FUNG|nr:MFS general substrate transporter [Hesseltinella vesiculosa]
MEELSRQITSQSTHSMLVTTLDGGRLVSHTMDIIHHHDDDSDVEESTSTSNTCSEAIEKVPTVASETTIKQIDAPKPVGTPPPSHSLFSWYAGAQDLSSDPRSFSTFKKTCILLIVALAGSSSPLASTIYYPSLTVMQKEFHTDDTTMNASISIFTFFTGFFPLLWASAGDIIGRRRIYLISFCISVIGSVCCGVSINITMFIIFRAISAIGSSSIMSMGAGTLADIFETHERGRAFAWYTCGPLLGPALGPIIGGYLNQAFGWRSTFYFLAMFNFCIWIVIFLFLPETFRTSLPVGNEKQTKPRPKKHFNPLQALDLLLNLNIVLAVAFVGVLFFLLYLVNTTFTRTYSIQYGFDSGTVGLCYLPNAIGCMIGGIAGGRVSDARYNRQVAKLGRQSENGGLQSNDTEVDVEQLGQAKVKPYPELRLGGVVFYGAILLQLLSITAYGWCVEKNVTWVAGVVCQFFVGLALMVPNVVLSTYMVDCYRKRGASVTACNNFVRYIMGGIGSLVSSPMQQGMGSGPMFTFIGLLLALFGANLVLIQYKGNSWRIAKEQKETNADKPSASV